MGSILLLLAQNKIENNTYKKYYLQADKYFNAPSTSPQTDSLALMYYERTIKILLQNKINDTLLVTCYTRTGIIYQEKNDDGNALVNFALATACKENNPKLPDSLFFKPLLFAGASYYNLSNYDSSFYFFKRAENIASHSTGIDEVERLYNKMGALYYQTGNYKQAINYFNKTINSLNKNSADYRELFIQYKINIGAAYFKLKDNEQAMAIYKELLPFKSRSQSSILHNMGIVYLEMGDYYKALNTLQPLDYNKQIKYTDLAKLYINSKNPDAAKYYLDSALIENTNKNGIRKNITQGLALKYYGDYFTVQHDIEKAITSYQQSILQLDADFSETDPYKNPTQFDGLHSSFNLFNSLIAKAKAFGELYQLKKSPQASIASLNTYKSALILARHVERFLDTDEARMFLKKNVAEAYADAIQTAVEVYEQTKNEAYLSDAFIMSETNKASILELNRQQLQIEQFPEIPQLLVHEEKNIKSNIATLTLQYAGITDSSKSASLQQRIAECEIKLSKIQLQLNENPKYHQLRFSNEVVSIKKIQTKYLNEHTALVSYYFTATKLVTFVITNNTFNYSAIPVDNSLYKDIFNTKTSLEEPELYDKVAATARAKKLFSQLLQPIFRFIKLKRNLIIIPHNELNYIPFETLVDPNTSNYLIKDFAISYNYAAGFLEKENKNKAETEILAFAPFTMGKNNNDSINNSFSQLPASKKEVTSLHGKVFLDSAATKNNFLKYASKYPIIHLATHAQANDKNPLESFITFYPKKSNTVIEYNLYEPEIYNLSLKNSMLVVLSACETGKGKLVNGEGLMSLSRAFSYAGCPSVITSLWKAEDNANAYLTQKLYFYLQKGYAKDEALQNAKLDYINDDTIPQNFKLPNFWAHLVLVGDASPIRNANNNYYCYIFSIVLIMTVIFLIKKSFLKQI